MGLETRGYRPQPGERDALRTYFHVEMSNAIRKAESIELFWGSHWSGWKENGNPKGDPMPERYLQIKQAHEEYNNGN